MAEQAPEGGAKETEAQIRQRNDAEARIRELDRRNKELERIANMQGRLSQVEQQVNQSKQPEKDPVWDPFMRPKVDPIIEEKLAPFKQVMFQQADKIDFLNTMIQHPEFKDPEFQQEVEQVRQQRLQQTGQFEPRENIIFALKGRDPARFAPKGEQQETKKEETRQPVHVETSPGIGSNRAEQSKERVAEDMSVEELEKWMAENNYKG